MIITSSGSYLPTRCRQSVHVKCITPLIHYLSLITCLHWPSTSISMAFGKVAFRVGLSGQPVSSRSMRWHHNPSRSVRVSSDRHLVWDTWSRILDHSARSALLHVMIGVRKIGCQRRHALNHSDIRRFEAGFHRLCAAIEDRHPSNKYITFGFSSKSSSAPRDKTCQGISSGGGSNVPWRQRVEKLLQMWTPPDSTRLH